MRKLFTYYFLFFLLSIAYKNSFAQTTKQDEYSHSENSDKTNTRIPLANGFFKTEENNYWTILNSSGNPISSARFEAIGDFQQSLIPVKKNNKWGFLDTSGQLLIDYKYDHISPFTDNVAVVRKENTWFLVDKNGSQERKMDFDYYAGREKNKLVVYKYGKKGYLDLTGKLLSPGWVENDYKTNKPDESSTPLSVNNVACPPNVNFEDGLFNQWECFVGFVEAVGNQNVITMSPFTPVPPDPNRHLIIPRAAPSALDFYGNFPVNPPRWK